MKKEARRCWCVYQRCFSNNKKETIHVLWFLFLRKNSGKMLRRMRMAVCYTFSYIRKKFRDGRGLYG